MKYPSGKLAFQAMLRGEVDVATVADMPLMHHGFSSDGVAVVATVATVDEGAWIVARRDRGIESPADLKGKRIGTQKNSAVHFFLGMFLLANRITADDVEVVFMEATELPGALASGGIDAFSMRNPFIRSGFHGAAPGPPQGGPGSHNPR